MKKLALGIAALVGVGAAAFLYIKHKEDKYDFSFMDLDELEGFGDDIYEDDCCECNHHCKCSCKETSN